MEYNSTNLSIMFGFTRFEDDGDRGSSAGPYLTLSGHYFKVVVGKQQFVVYQQLKTITSNKQLTIATYHSSITQSLNNLLHNKYAPLQVRTRLRN